MPDLHVLNYDVYEDLSLENSLPYGAKKVSDDGREFVYCYWDGSAPSAVVQGDVLFIGTAGQSAVATATKVPAVTDYNYGADARDAIVNGLNPAVAAPATSSVEQEFGVAVCDLAEAGGVWLQTRGRCPFANVLGHASIALGTQLQGVNGQKYLTYDGGTALTADSVAIAEVAYTTTSAALKAVYLHGRKATIG